MSKHIALHHTHQVSEDKLREEVRKWIGEEMVKLAASDPEGFVIVWNAFTSDPLDPWHMSARDFVKKRGANWGKWLHEADLLTDDSASWEELPEDIFLPVTLQVFPSGPMLATLARKGYYIAGSRRAAGSPEALAKGWVSANVPTFALESWELEAAEGVVRGLAKPMPASVLREAVSGENVELMSDIIGSFELPGALAPLAPGNYYLPMSDREVADWVTEALDFPFQLPSERDA